MASRRKAEELITAGRVTVDGQVVRELGVRVDPERQEIRVDGKRLRPERRRYIMLNKPPGYITTVSDERGRRTVMELLADVPQRVYPVGRLDKDSEGLLLFTNDGAFANLVTHPGGGVAKLYRATVRPMATEAQTTRLASGVTLDDGSRTMPASVRVVAEYPDRSVLEITLREGKNRQVRRMCEAVGLQVARLRRSAVGPLKLGMLKPGQWRELTPCEVNALKGSAGKSTRQTPAKKQQPR